MVAKRSDEGDLFPRGNAPNSTPRIKKRNGQVLFGPESKRLRQSRSLESESLSKDPVMKSGTAFSLSQLTEGMTVLGYVVRANERTVEFVLPSGIRATCVDDTLLEDEILSRISAPMIKKASDVDEDDTSSDDESSSDKSMSDSESGSDEDAGTHVRPVWQVISVGLVLPLVIVKVEKNPTGTVSVSVSLKPHLINAGLNPIHLLKKNFPAFAAVLSAEDHGYILSFGSNIPHTAFLPYELCDEASQNQRLRPGTPVQVITVCDSVTKSKKRKASVAAVVRVSARASDVFPKAVDILKSPTIQDLRAGMALRARVIQEGPGGLSLLFMGVFSISVDITHLPCNSEGRRSIPVDSQVTVRLLCVDAAFKTLIGSLLPSFVKDQYPPPIPVDWKIGTLLKPVLVETIKPRCGLILRCGDVSDKTGKGDPSSRIPVLEGDMLLVNEQKKAISSPLYAHISKVADSRRNDLEKFRPGTVINDGARIISILRMDGVANVDLRPSVLSRKALTIDEIEPGCVYDCKVLNHTALGSMSVAIDGDPHLVGLVRSEHVSDVPISTKKWSLHKSLQIGATLKCLVLSVDTTRGKVYLSARKSLISPTYPVLTSLEAASEQFRKPRDGDHLSKELLYTGTVLCVTEKCNLLVGFCNKLAGLVSQAEMCLDMTNRSFSYTKDEIETMFPPGQTISVRIIGVNLQVEKLYLSLDLQACGRGTELHQHQLGSIFDIEVISVNRDAGHFIALAPRHAESKTRENNGQSSKETSINCDDQAVAGSVEFDGNLKCHLPYGHLSDFPAMSECLAVALEKQLKGTERNSKSRKFILRSAMVLCYREGTPILTLKESLKSASLSNKLPSTFEEVKQLAQDCNGQDLILRGYVKALPSVGVIVGFKGNEVGFVRKSRIADFFISDPARVLKIDQSLVVKMESMDDEKKRFDLSARQSDVGAEEIYQDVEYFTSLLKQWSQFMGTSALDEKFPIGSVTKATLDTVLAYGVQYRLGSQPTVTGVVLDMDNDTHEVVVSKSKSDLGKLRGQSEKTRKIAPNVAGAIHVVRVLDIDPISGVVDLSRDKDLIESGRKADCLSPDKRYDGRVLLVKSTYIIVAVRKTKTQTVIACSPPPSLTDTLVVRPGAIVTCRALMRGPETSRHTVVIDWEAFRGNLKLNVPHAVGKGTARSSNPLSILKRTAIEDPSGVKGMILTGKVTQCFEHYSYLAIGRGVVGHLHVLNVDIVSAEEASNASLGRLNNDLKSRFSLPKVEARIPQCFVVGVRKSAGSVENSPLIVEVALKKELCESIKPVVGQRLIGIVKSLAPCLSSDVNGATKTRTVLSLGPSLKAFCSNVDCLGTDKYIEIGMNDAVMCMVTNVNRESEGSIRVSLSDNGNDGSGFFSGIVDSVSPGHGIRVKIPWLARDGNAKTVSWGTVDICDMGVDFDDVKEMMDSIKDGAIVRVNKVAMPASGENNDRPRILLTMRNESEGVVDPTISPDNVKKLKPGTPLRGFVRTVGKFGCFVTIGRDVVAHVRKNDLSDGFIKDPEAEFPIGALVSGTVSEVHENGGVVRVRLSFRKRPRATLQNDKLEKSGLEEGQIVVGIVKRVGKYGAVLQVKPGVTGLLHTSEVDQDRFIERPFEEWVVGQKLKCVVIKAEDGKVMLGTKRCYFEAAGVEEENVDEIIEQNEQWKSKLISDFQRQDMGVTESSEPNSVEIVDDDSTASDGASDGPGLETSAADLDTVKKMEEDEEAGGHEGLMENSQTGAASLVVPQEFDFGAEDDSDSGDHDNQMENDNELGDGAKPEAVRSRSTHDKREKKRVKQAEEQEIRLREEALARGDDIAETAEDYERMVMGEPNSSAVWIRYMAFCVELSQIEKARAVAERALETIALEKEMDRTNVWVAYINMEAQFGNMYGMDLRNEKKIVSENVEKGSGERSRILREAAVLRVFDRACERVTDVENLHLTVATALRESNPLLAAEILRRATRKFKTSENVWIAMGQAQFSNGDVKTGRQCLEKALLSIEKQKHLGLVTKFAQFEYKMGSPERGRTVFESVVGNAKKRIDIWNIYLDMEVGLCKKSNGSVEDVERTRQIFARFAALDLSSKKMKFAFQKWLEFEKTFGERDDQKKVKQLAREYVERNVAGE